jgi:DNA mismatch repair protein MutS2
VPYPKNIETKLEFDQIKDMLRSHCLSELGMQYVDKIRFVSKFDVLEKILQQVNEFRILLTTDTPFPSEHYYDIRPYLQRAGLAGSFLAESEWQQIRLLLQTFALITRYFEQRNDRYMQLAALFGGIQFNAGILKHIERIIDDKGELRPNASPDLSKISAQVSEKEKEARKRINRIFEHASEKNWLADSGITIRDGRLVLPVLAEHKRNISGFVHDESATGQTVFIEPTEIFEINNRIRELQIAYKRERERILIELTDKLRPHLPEMELYLQRIGIIDFVRAKAIFAVALNASMPLMHKQPYLNWVDAYHPLLKINHQKSGLPVVPLQITLSQTNRILVISGPNAGGKSVCLKTVGLLQYMLQCGLLIPVKEHSEAGLFQDIMADIGDEQSIENDLSTYSSHLLHMKQFTTFADNKTLFLIDEFGTGTDPQFGGPLAEAILQKLNQKQAWGVVTTHYSNLKNFASNTRGLQNACMLFNQEQMQPLYLLEIGKPGSSYAFELATKSGLHASVIDYAKQKVGDKQKRVDDLLIELEREKKHLYDLKQRFEKRDEEAKKLVEEYGLLKADLDSNRKKIIATAKQEALSIISEANSRIENTIRELREKKAESDVIKKVRTEIKKETDELKKDAEEVMAPQPVLHADVKITSGTWVVLNGQTQSGEVVEVSKGRALVAFGDLRSWVPLQKLSVVVPATKVNQSAKNASVDLNEKMKHFSSEINLIGVRGEDAMKQLQQYMDDAFVLGFKQFRIVHGKGYGILRKLIREYLKASKLVESYQDEHIELGGDGVTIVKLK